MKRFEMRHAWCGIAAIVVATAAVGLGACAPQPEVEMIEPPDTRAVDEAAIRGAIEEWVAAAQAKDAEAFASVYAEDGVLMVEAIPDMRGPAEIREGTAEMMQDPNFDLYFEPAEVTVARSGDIAYEVGTYRLTMSGEDGEALTGGGQYVVVWEKQSDGTWKVVVDAPVSDPSPGE